MFLSTEISLSLYIEILDDSPHTSFTPYQAATPRRKKISKRQGPTHSIHSSSLEALACKSLAEQPKKDVSSHSRLTCGAANDRSKGRSSIFTGERTIRG